MKQIGMTRSDSYVEHHHTLMPMPTQSAFQVGSCGRSATWPGRPRAPMLIVVPRDAGAVAAAVGAPCAAAPFTQEEQHAARGGAAPQARDVGAGEQVHRRARNAGQHGRLCVGLLGVVQPVRAVEQAEPREARRRRGEVVQQLQVVPGNSRVDQVGVHDRRSAGAAARPAAAESARGGRVSPSAMRRPGSRRAKSSAFARSQASRSSGVASASTGFPPLAKWVLTSSSGSGRSSRG